MLKYTKEIKEYIKQHCLGNTCRNLVKELYKKFKFKTTINGLRTYMNTIHCRFTDKKINKPKRNWNQHKVGDERVKKGMVQIKVAEPNKWKQKQVYLWEQAHKQKVKNGEVVVFLDGNTQNFKINNLYKVSRAIHGIKNIWYKNNKGVVPYQIAEIKHIIRVKNGGKMGITKQEQNRIGNKSFFANKVLKKYNTNARENKLTLAEIISEYKKK